VPRVFVPLAAAMNECVDLVCGAGDGGIVPSHSKGRLSPMDDIFNPKLKLYAV